MRISRKQAVAGLVLTLTGVAFYIKQSVHSPGEIILYSDTKLMKQELERHVTLGSDIRSVKHLMEQNGYSCYLEINGTFQKNLNFEQVTKKVAQSGKTTTLECVKSTSFIFIYYWSAKFTYKNGKVIKIDNYYTNTVGDL